LGFFEIGKKNVEPQPFEYWLLLLMENEGVALKYYYEGCLYEFYIDLVGFLEFLECINKVQFNKT
jgi:hypothetical protein